MSDFYYHAVSSAKMFGGEPDVYIKIHAWMDRGKSSFADFRHRALTHHAEGIWEAIEHFAPTITTSTGVQVPVKRICEAHVLEDLGTIPSLKDWLGLIKPERWMAPEPNLLFREGKLNQLLEQL